MKKYCSVTRVIVHPHIWAQISMCLLDKMIDFIGVSKGHGVNKSWHTKKLPRKTHKRLEEGGLHWILASFSCGIHGRSCRGDRRSSPHGDPQGLLSSKKKGTKSYSKSNSLLVIFSSRRLHGWSPKKRVFTIRKVYRKVQTRRSCTAREAIELKFIDTTSKFGHWCFLTVQEKRFFKGEEKSHI
uniref:Uncharacterized protein n=1 Tax=Oryzias latipes TaxID=8090 RepID=A0A3P9L7U9_ORYLA